MKTREEWEALEINLHEYLTEPCEIDEEMYLYIGEIVAPFFCRGGLVQLGEPMSARQAFDWNEPDVCYRDTVSHINEKYFYLGVLPDFRNAA